MKLVRQLVLCVVGLELAIDMLYGDEGVNQVSTFQVEVFVDPAINVSLWLGLDAYVKLCFDNRETVVKSGVITALDFEMVEASQTIRVSVTLQSPLALLRYACEPRVVLNENRLTVLKQLLLQSARFSSDACFFHLVQSYQNIPMIIQLFNESNFDFFERLVSEAGLFYWQDQKGMHFCDQALLCLNDPLGQHYRVNDGLIYQFWQESCADGTVYHANTYLGALKPGYCLEIDAQYYLVMGVKHYVKAGMPYWNQVTLQLQETAKPRLHKQIPLIPWCFQAMIESPHEQALLDDKGQYRIKFLFDQATADKGRHSAAVPKMQLYGDASAESGASGIHFPLHDGVEVLVACTNGDLYCPIILGALPNSVQKNVVTSDNPQQNILKTGEHLQILMDDSAQNMLLETPEQLLRLDAPKKSLSVAIRKGDIKSYAEKDTQLHQGGNAVLQIGDSQKISANATASISQKNEDMAFHSKQSIDVRAFKALIAGSESIQLNALDRLVISAAAISKILREGKQFWEVKETLKLAAKHLCVKGQRSIIVSCGKSAIEIKPDSISLYGKSILFDVRQCLVKAKRTDFRDARKKDFKAVVFESVPALASLSSVSTKDDLKISHCLWRQASAHIGSLVFADCFVENIREVREGVLKVFANQNILVAEQAFSVRAVSEAVRSENVSLHIPWKVAENTQVKRLVYQHAIFYTFEVLLGGEKNQKPSSNLAILTDLTVTIDYQSQLALLSPSVLQARSANKKIFLTKVENKTALFSAIRLGKVSLRLLSGDRQQMTHALYCQQSPEPWCQVAVKLPADLKAQKQRLKAVFPPCTVRLDAKPSVHLKSPRLLDDQRLLMLEKMCHQQPKNITLFVHGFDVSPGKFGQYIASVKKESFIEKWGRCFSDTVDDGLTVTFTGIDATVFQTLKGLKKRFSHVSFEKQFLTRYAVNGTGDHAWLLAVEYYLNKACGLAQKGYDFYQRLMGVFWPAEPDMILDYMAVTKRLRVVGQKTAMLAKELLHAGFEVNIIGHSLGCGVVLQALNVLGQDNTLLHKINRCFLWEAAVPNTVFSEEGLSYADSLLKMESDIWYVPYAKKSAKQFVVLHSENDNVLGPIPAEQSQGLNQFSINAQKPLFAELLPAVLLTYLGLGAVYSAAMVLTLPIAKTLNQASFEAFYQAWRKRFHPVYDKKGRLFPETLADRVGQLSPAEISVAREALYQRYLKNKAKIHRYLDPAKKRSKADRIAVDAILFVLDRPVMDQEIKNFFVPPPNAINDAVGDDLFLDRYAFYDNFHTQFSVLISSLFFDSQLHYPSALGYRGADLKDPAIQAMLHSGQLRQIDESDCLFSHSGMKNPSPELFEKIYKKAIWHETPQFHFGAYPKNF